MAKLNYDTFASKKLQVIFFFIELLVIPIILLILLYLKDIMLLSKTSKQDMELNFILSISKVLGDYNKTELSFGEKYILARLDDESTAIIVKILIMDFNSWIIPYEESAKIGGDLFKKYQNRKVKIENILNALMIEKKEYIKNLIIENKNGDKFYDFFKETITK